VNEHIFITGAPKVGKTTLHNNILQSSPLPTHGFLTEEVLVDGKRIAFTIVSSDGQNFL